MTGRSSGPAAEGSRNDRHTTTRRALVAGSGAGAVAGCLDAPVEDRSRPGTGSPGRSATAQTAGPDPNDQASPFVDASRFGGDVGAIQAAVDSLGDGGGTVFVPRHASPYPFAEGERLVLPDGVTVWSNGARLVAGEKTVQTGDTTAIRNADFETGNDEITLAGFELEGTIRLRAGNTEAACRNVHIQGVRIRDTPDFGFFLEGLVDFSVRNVDIRNHDVGDRPVGNDGVHCIGCRDGTITDVTGYTGDDLVSIEAADRPCHAITVASVHGRSAIANLLKFFVNDSTAAGVDVHDVAVFGATARDTHGACDFDSRPGAEGSIHDITVVGLTGHGLDEGITAKSNAKVHDVTFRDAALRDVANVGISTVGADWTLENVIVDGAGTAAPNQCVRANAPGTVIDGGRFRAPSNHAIVLGAPGCRVTDAQITTADTGGQGVHVAAPRSRIADCVVDSGDNFAIGSAGKDAGSHVSGNTCVSNRIGTRQFGHDVVFDGNAPAATIAEDVLTLQGGATPAATVTELDAGDVDGLDVEWTVWDAPPTDFALEPPVVRWRGTDEASIRFEWAEDPGDGTSVDIRYEVTPQTVVESWALDADASAGQSAGPTTITEAVPHGSFDGDVTEAPEGPAIPLLEDGTYVDAPAGDSDRTVDGTVRLRWSDDGLAIDARIQDDAHHQPYTGPDTWSGDSLQIGLTGDRSSGFAEFTMALTSAGPQAYRRFQSREVEGGLHAATDLDIRRDDDAGETIYRARIPWSSIGIESVAAGDDVAASIVVNDNDGDGRRGYLRWGRGIAASKDASQFNRLTLRE